MPRLARLDAPGVLHHIMIRGIERRNIFRVKKDREDFLERLSKLIPETQTCCYAWVLMSNHAHLLLRTGKAPLATVMRRLLTGYVVSFNRRHKRRGHLFQNRYKSIVCQEDIYLRELVRYIHLNPVRSGIVKDLTQLNAYAYSGHSAIMGKTDRPWQDINYVLGFFGKRVPSARREYLSYVKVGYDQGHRDEFSGGGLIRSLGGWSEVSKTNIKGGIHVKSDERILGESTFVSDILSQANEKYERKYELKRRGYDLSRVAMKVSEIFNIDAKEILSKGKQQKKVKARSLFCYWAVKELEVSLTELSRRIGISVPAVGYSVERGSIIAKENNYKLIENKT
ncbi:MAG: transposase [Deltaproteobacteria bacterium]|nr:transposase [Deltaproteobacteria bacterium]